LRRYGLSDWAKARYAALKVTASACVECGVCETRCPYGLPIRSMLKQVAKDMGEN
jgi:predicted aldo/keto reductase-like oxidoreductase